MERRLTTATALTASSDASSPLSQDAARGPPAALEASKRRRTSACDDLAALHFTGEVRRQLLEDAGAAVDDVLAAMTRDDAPTALRTLRARKGKVEYYPERSTSARRGEARFCCVSAVEAPVEDVVQLCVLSDADTLLQHCRVLYDNVASAQVLSALESPSPSRPYRSVYVRYAAFQTPSMLRSRRDMLVVVATDVRRLPDGSSVGYCVWDSLNLTELTSFDVPPGVVRTRMARSGLVVQNSGECNARSTVAYVVGIQAGGGFATRLATRLAMPRFGATLSRVCAHVRRQRLDPRTFVLQSKWPDKREPFGDGAGVDLGASRVVGLSVLEASRLAAAGKSTKRRNCHACGQVVCSSCTELEEVDVPGVRRVRVPVCTTCRNFSGEKRPTLDDAPERPGASSWASRPLNVSDLG